MKEKFESLKKAFSQGPARGYPDYSETAEPFILDTDWSRLCCAAVLSQMQNGREVFLACAAKKCSEAESHYPSYKGEILACIVGIKKFEHMLLCRKFILRTDASALKHLSSLKENRGIFSRWLSFLADFEFDVIHSAGVTHTTADSFPAAPMSPTRHYITATSYSPAFHLVMHTDSCRCSEFSQKNASPPHHKQTLC